MVSLLKDFEPIFVKYFDEQDMSKGMCYLIDIVDASALPFLAKQFKVDGYRGWDLANTELKQRELIKSGIEIAKHVGTPYAIKRALAALGYDNVVINENIGFLYDGTYNHDGTIFYSSANWVNFSITITVASLAAITPEIEASIRLLINEYKNARSVLVTLTFTE